VGEVEGVKSDASEGFVETPGVSACVSERGDSICPGVVGMCEGVAGEVDRPLVGGLEERVEEGVGVVERGRFV
jgi:hypothetical protein